MALPSLLRRREREADPFELARNDFGTMLSQLFGGAMMGGAGGGPLAELASYGVDIREDADRICIDADLPGVRKEDVDISLENGVLTIMAERHEESQEPQSQQQQQPQVQQAQGAQQSPESQGSQQQEQQGQSSQQNRAGAHQQQVQRRQQRSGAGARSGGRQDYLLRERRSERFIRSFTLPTQVDEQNVDAKLDNGVLKIVLRKREENKPKRIAVS